MTEVKGGLSEQEIFEKNFKLSAGTHGRRLPQIC